MNEIEKALARLYAEPAPTHCSVTLQPLTAADLEEFEAFRAALARLIRKGVLEYAGEENGEMQVQLTEQAEQLLDSELCDEALIVH